MLDDLLQGNVIEQHDGFAVDDSAVINSPEGLFNGPFQHFDIFTFGLDTASCAGAIPCVIFRDVEVELLGDGARGS